MRGFALSLLAIACLAHCGVAQEWTRFRGPNGAGGSEAEGIPATWKEADYAFKVKLPGVGHSSPAIWGDKLFILSADPEKATRYVLCLDADSGEELWRREYPSQVHSIHLRSSFASCTPAVDDERVYFAWSSPKKTTFLALAHNGDLAWELDLGPFVSQHGFGTSPLIYQELAILANLQEPSAAESARRVNQIGLATPTSSPSIAARARRAGKRRNARKLSPTRFRHLHKRRRHGRTS